MEYNFAALHGFFDGGDIAEIAGRCLCLQSIEIFQVAGGAD
jgi:hypothetical protein